MISKEIDSKQDLQQEETVVLPAEHRSFPEPQHPSGISSHSGGNGPTTGSDVQINDAWPLGRPDVSQIKVYLFKPKIIDKIILVSLIESH